VTPLKLSRESKVIFYQRSHIGDSMAHLSAAIYAKTECEARPLIRIDANSLKHGGVNHSTTTKFNPARLRTRSTPFSMANCARDLKLSGGFSEGKIGRAKS
jgi:hypothetical protein